MNQIFHLIPRKTAMSAPLDFECVCNVIIFHINTNRCITFFLSINNIYWVLYLFSYYIHTFYRYIVYTYTEIRLFVIKSRRYKNFIFYTYMHRNILRKGIQTNIFIFDFGIKRLFSRSGQKKKRENIWLDWMWFYIKFYVS